jgi:glutamate-5-semialdehyde dehydrogenase
VIAVIFESRPEAMPQILSLCLKTGNAVVLKGGAEAEKSNRILFDIMQKAAEKAGVPTDAFALIETRADVKQLLGADGFVDLIIPRGSNDLVRYIQNNTRIPVLGHADGICHIYIDESASVEMAVSITLDSKVQYPSACNSVETVLIHKAILERVLPPLCLALQKEHVELRLDSCSQAALQKSRQSHTGADLPLDWTRITAASEDDWASEYCDLILSVKAVDSLQDAIAHINKYGSGHTESMVGQDAARFQQFFAQVNSSGIFLNASTRFADGFRYGFGAEVGISTAKLHPRGPVGMEGLVTYKYKLLGKGHLVASYVGPNARTFTHRSLDS